VYIHIFKDFFSSIDMEYNNSSVKCVSNTNYTIIDLESDGLKLGSF